MDNFGGYLRNERESRGVPLEEIADNTKVNMRFLLALENNDYDQLPSEVFIKGFIRSYAKTIGGNADEMVAIYEESLDNKERTDQIRAEDKTIEGKEDHKKEILWAFFIVGLILLIILAFFSFQKFQASSPNSASDLQKKALTAGSTKTHSSLRTKLNMKASDQKIFESSIKDPALSKTSDSVIISTPTFPKPDKIVINNKNQNLVLGFQN